MSRKSLFGDNIKDFKLGDKIGYGGFAEVYKARCLKPGLENTYVAIKKINKKRVNERRCRDKIEKEIDIHSHLPHHPSFVKFYTSFEDDKHWYLVLELCTGGSFEEYVKQKGHLSEEEAIKLIKQVIDGVQCLHYNLIIHRDLSLRNLLLTDCHQVKIADFGLAVKLSHYDEKTNTVLGTANFMSPEVVSHDSYDFKTDCWSIGCVLYALLYGSPPFNDKKREYIMESVKHSQLTFPNYASREAKELLKSLLNKNPKQRTDLQGALKYAFFEKYEKSGYRNKINSQKSCDSGMSSLSSSGSKKSRSTHTSGNGSNHHRSQNEKRNRFKESASITENYDDLCDNAFGCQYNHAISQKQRFELPSCQNRHDSQYDTPVKNLPECPSYPADLQYLAKRNLNSQMCCSDYDSLSYKSHSVKDNNSSKHCTTYRQNCINDYTNDTVKDPLCSHDQYCLPENNCFHKLSCCCRQLRSESCPSLRNFANENKNYGNVENAIIEKCLKDIVDPLNTARIGYRRKEIEKKDMIISILSDGQVCLEYLKFKKNKKYVNLVYYISDNGLQIFIYKPKKKIPLNPDQPPQIPHNEHEVQYFTFENLPNTHWKKYQFAKYFVDKVRGITPKVTIYGEHAACIMMENMPNPNFEMNFYNGFQITEIGNKKTIKDKNGSLLTKNDDINYIMKEFAEMKEKCIMLEKNIETFHDSNFPVVLGKKPDMNKRIIMQDHKETLPLTRFQSPSINEQNTTVKKCHITISTENNFLQNTFQRSISTPSLSAKSTNSAHSKTNTLSHLKSLEVVNEWVIAEYTDGIQMWLSMQEDKMFFKNASTQALLSNTQHPHLIDRFNNDSRDILRRALLKEVKRKT